MPKSQPREQNPTWRGDAADPDTGRDRARRWFPLPTVCCECEVAPATERHHLDGNPLNNTNNVLPVCRRCHMRLDGRLDHIQALGRYRSKTKPPVICTDCDQDRRHYARGRCQGCYQRWYRAH
jgi:hypothetical protein